MKASRPGLVLSIVLLAALAAAGAWFWRRSRQPQPLRLAGTIEARGADVGSLVGGRVASVEVDEGERVEAGQILVILQSELIDPQVDEQAARVEQARAELRRVQAGPRDEEVARARIAWQAAETDRKRIEQLFRDGIVGRREYDQALVAEATSEETYLERRRGSRGEDLDAASAALAGAERRLALLEEQRRELTVRAPVAGVIEALDLRPGDLVAAHQPVATLLETDQLWLRAFAPEPRLGEIRLGQRAFLTVDSFPQREFTGKVVEIRDRGEYTPRNLQTLEQRNDLVFGVKVELEPAPELKAGMSAIVRLE